MTSSQHLSKSSLIEKTIALAQQALDQQMLPLGTRFIRQFFANVSNEDLRNQDIENLYGSALAMFAFARKRSAGKAKLRVYTPTPEEHGWKSAHTIVEIVNDDMPFIVDSVASELSRLGPEIYLIIHPVLQVIRDRDGQLIAIEDTASGAADRSNGAMQLVESILQVQISEQAGDDIDHIVERLEKVLSDVRVVVDDWQPMHDRCSRLLEDLESSPPPVAGDDLTTAKAFLKWLKDDHFTYLGYREYDYVTTDESSSRRIPTNGGLGLLRDPDRRVIANLRDLDRLPEEVKDYILQPQLLRITKADERSSVHRSVLMDAIAIKKLDHSGKVTGEHQFLGLFTSSAYSVSPGEIPLLREKVARIIERSGFAPRSHDGKALAHILATYPRDELFQATEDELFGTAMGILQLQERQRVAIFTRRDPFHRFVSVLVFVPRDRFDTRLRESIQSILARSYGGEVSAYYTHLTDEALARLHVLIKTDQKDGGADIDLSAVEQQIIEAARSWSDQLREALIESRGEAQGLASMRQFANAFPAGYQEKVSPQAAVFDLSKVEDALHSGQITMNLYRPLAAPENQLGFKIYIATGPVPLSDVLPMLENMGLRVIGEIPFEIRPAGYDGKVLIHDFTTETEDGQPVDLRKVRDDFHDAFFRVWTGDMENDGFNKLVLSAGLNAENIKILRAYCKYLLQARAPFSQSYMEQALKNNREITRRLAALFEARFDPSRQNGAQSEAEQLVNQITELLNDVANLDEDRIIRRYLNIIEATLRSNFYRAQTIGAERHCISFKIDSQKVEELPLPRPYREIFVYSPRVEGIHLRFGAVARGGLRWSDRREDFRTEILGLVKAQHVKNAVIVPVGSKGGFYVKKRHAPEATREEILDEGISCYRMFLGGLLDVTDNLKGTEIVPPPGVVRYDADDPYLVVAADKGTATFSDIANSVSAQYGFWLGDAFASGGSAGYDHKKMGITARGAWESVKRHFRELGKNIQTEDFTCIGVGDMGGDVFGNGMLLSKHIKLVGAFNHLHIFIDPDPDPATSWQERKRLFDLPRSSWADYNRELISAGGGVFERKAKSLSISPQMKKLLSITADRLTPDELIRALLKSSAELLWFGGIGTYVKSRSETDADVGDRTNDSLRIDATDLCVKVVGEGANLGMTQLARIEYAFNGGKLNTDAIDNSAGVDCSDHEVNIKILLSDVENSGDLTRKQRNELLEQMTDEVAELVLRDNYLQGQAISATTHVGARLTDRMIRFMRALEKSGQLDRAVEFLPDDETIANRRKQKLGLTRPEIAVLLSYAKIALYDDLLHSTMPDEAFLRRDLTGYFPTPLREQFSGRIDQHRLKREIVATVVANEIVNRAGLTFIHELGEKTGMPSDEIAKAYIIASELYDMPSLWRDIEALDNIADAGTQLSMLIECSRLIKRQSIWFLRERQGPLDIAGEINVFGPGVRIQIENIGKMISPAERKLMDVRIDELTGHKVPKSLAERIAGLTHLTSSCDIAWISLETDKPVNKVAAAYFHAGARFGFDWLRRYASQIPIDSVWDKQAVSALIDDLYGHQALLTRRLCETESAASIEEATENWAEQRVSLVNRTNQLLDELKADSTPDLAMLAVANRQIKSLVGG